MSSLVTIENTNLSRAWLEAVEIANKAANPEICPMLLSIELKGGNIEEDRHIRNALDEELGKAGHPFVKTVAGTIFPNEFWNPQKPREQLYERYLRVLSKIKASDPRNKRGTYFERLILGGKESQPNQVEHIISTANQPGHRRSALQASVFDPKKDQSQGRRQGFPCLQHLTIVSNEKNISLNAFYASQTLLEKAYGNYLGLCQLGRFIGHELGLPLERANFFVGIAKLSASIKKPKTIATNIINQGVDCKR